MLRIISERTLEIDEELSICFKDWQKAFDRVKWTKLMQILKETGIDWTKLMQILKETGIDFASKTSRRRLTESNGPN